MGVRSAKDGIREARRKAGMTQEQLSEGICSPQALSRIETGVRAVSPATFQALMEQAGVSRSRFPVFAGRKAFDCYCALQYAAFYLNNWQLSDAWEELKKAENAEWANDRLSYQKWLFLRCRLQFFSCCGSHEENRDALLAALRFTRPTMDLSDFQELVLTQTELEILTLLAEEALYLDDIGTCSILCGQLECHLSQATFSITESQSLAAHLAIVKTKLLLAQKSYAEARTTADAVRSDIAHQGGPAFLFPLAFLSGLCSYYLQDTEQADALIKAAFYSAHGFGSCYATVCRSFLARRTAYTMTDYMQSLPDIPLVSYPAPVPLSISAFSEKPAQDSPYTLGDIIRDLRTQQGVSQQILCQGLCSASKLSKIENSTLLPDIALSEALLQRLGISERIFEFWGDEKDARFHELKHKLLNTPDLLDKRAFYINEIDQVLQKEDMLYRQRYLTVLASLASSPAEEIQLLTEALHMTLPDFRIQDVCRYRLSWEEISILNHLAYAYCNTQDSYFSSLYFSQLLEYWNMLKPSPVFQSNTFSHTLSQHCSSLYVQKQFSAILRLYQNCDKRLLRSHLSTYGDFLFYLSQALGECGDYDGARLQAVYGCNLEFLAGFPNNSRILEKALKKDFDLCLCY